MSTHTRPAPGRSQRDELERLQEELRDVRRQRTALPAQNAELATQVARLEEEVRWLRRTLEVASDEQEQPASSLPEQLTPPFQVIRSRRTAYGRTRFALPVLLPMLGIFLILAIRLADQPLGLLGLGVLLPVCLAPLFFLQGPEDDEQGVAWSFDAEGFAPSHLPAQNGKVPYRAIKKVKVVQGPLQLLFGFGSVRVTWTPAAPTPLGRAAAWPNRTIDLDMLDDPKRLMEWLKARAAGGAHVG